MRTAALVLAGLVIAPAVRAQAPARDAGLLLGLSTASESDSVPQILTTHWITRQGSATRAVQTIPGLVVPGAAGFRRAVITRACRLPQTDVPEDIEKVHCVDTLWTGPAEQPLPPITTEWMTPCSSETVDLLFASPSLLSQRSWLWVSDCAARSFSDFHREWVRPWERDSTVAFGTLGPGAAAAYAEAGERALNVGAPHDRPQPQDSSCLVDPLDETGWRIERERGGWRGVLFQQLGSELCQLEEPIAWPLPVVVTGYADPPVPWPAVTAAVPEARQAWVAPDGTLLLIAAPDGNRLLELTGSGARHLLELPAGRVVMVQWATGGAVARWTRMLAPLR